MNRDLQLLEDIIQIAQYLSWQEEVGDKKAREIIAEIHAGKYGAHTGIWVQAGDAMARLKAGQHRKSILEREWDTPEEDEAWDYLSRGAGG